MDRFANTTEVTARPQRRLELALLAVILLFALVVRLYSLGSFPDTLLADEADNAQDSLRIMYGLTPPNGIFGLDWTAQPAFSAYLLSAFFYLFGFSSFVIRLPSALLSTLALVPFFYLLRRQLSIVASTLGTLLLSTAVWYLNFSRSGWNNVDVCLYMLGAMACLIAGLAATDSTVRPDKGRTRWLYFAAAGVFCALSLNAYPSGRAVPIAIALFIPIALWFYRRRWKQQLAGFALLAVVTALLVSPLAAYILNNWDAYNGRSKVVALVNNPDYISNPAATLTNQIIRNVRGLWDGSVNNTAQYTPAGEPQLDSVTGVLVVIGMVATFLLSRLRRRPETWLWWVMLLVSWFSTQVLTVGTPNGARGVGYMPTLLYFAAAGIDTLITLFDPAPLLARRVVVAAASVVMIGAVLWNLNHYVTWQSLPRTRQDRYLYVTTNEFPLWAAEVSGRAHLGQATINVGTWRDLYPIADIQHPEPRPASSVPATPTAAP